MIPISRETYVSHRAQAVLKRKTWRVQASSDLAMRRLALLLAAWGLHFQAPGWLSLRARGSARHRCTRHAVDLPEMPTVQELDDMYPELARNQVAVLAQGENWAVVYNPSGCTAHPHKELPKDREGMTLMGRAKKTLRRQRLHLVGRLDRSVSGVSLVAFDPDTAQALHEVNVSKVYYAFRLARKPCLSSFRVVGSSSMRPMRLCRNSGEHFLQRGRFSIDRELADKKPFGKRRGKKMTKPSHTDVEVLLGSAGPDCCLVRAEPTTGRYHQIRRHLRNISLPILGDTYNKRRTREYFESFGLPLPRRVMLHLHSMKVPATEHTPEIHVTCPLPPKFISFLRRSPGPQRLSRCCRSCLPTRSRT
ncbi:unnamed protein product [Effrenium voratum]|nr:unnamed protein product [Effrenium voratum]